MPRLQSPNNRITYSVMSVRHRAAVSGLYVLAGITVFADLFSGIRNWVIPMNGLSYSCLVLALLHVGAGSAAIVETSQASRIICR